MKHEDEIPFFCLSVLCFAVYQSGTISAHVPAHSSPRDERPSRAYPLTSHSSIVQSAQHRRYDVQNRPRPKHSHLARPSRKDAPAPRVLALPLAVPRHEDITRQTGRPAARAARQRAHRQQVLARRGLDLEARADDLHAQQAQLQGALVVRGRGERGGVHLAAVVDVAGEEDAVLEVEAGVQGAGADHVREGALDARFVSVEGRGQRGQRDAREGDEVLHDGLAAHAEVDLRHVRVQVQVEQVVGAVGVEDAQAGRVLGGDEEGDGAPHVRLQLEVIAEGGVVEHARLELVPVHGGEGAEAAVDGDVVGGEDLVVGVRVVRVVELRLEHAWVGAEEAEGGIFVASRRHLREAHRRGEFGLRAVDLAAGSGAGETAQLLHGRLDAQPVALVDGNVHEMHVHDGDVSWRLNGFSFFGVCFDGIGKVSDEVVMST